MRPREVVDQPVSLRLDVLFQEGGRGSLSGGRLEAS